MFSVFQRNKRVAIANTTAGEEVAVEISDEPHDRMDYSAPTTQPEIKEDMFYPNDDYPEDYSGGEIVEDENNDDDAGYILMNGEKVYEGPID